MSSYVHVAIQELEPSALPFEHHQLVILPRLKTANLQPPELFREYIFFLFG